jgi:homoserine kinase type II
MLWESTDPLATLPKRFQFATPEAAAHWLLTTVAHTYGIEVASVDRLVMSSYNLLAWLTTAAGPLLAKCCVFAPAHQRLLEAGELVRWLAQIGLPVSAPFVAMTGAVQVRCDHLSVGVQRVIAGELLDPTPFEQAHAAGVTLAQIHQALAIYPRATAFASPSAVSTLSALIRDWAKQKMATITDPDLMAGSTFLLKQVEQRATTPLATQLVHGDYRAANILWQANQIVAVLDFEEVRWGYRVNDLAWATVHLGTRYHDWGPVPRAVHHTFLRSYTAVQPLTDLEQAWLPLLLIWHSISLTQAATDKPTYDLGLEAIQFYRHLLQ